MPDGWPPGLVALLRAGRDRDGRRSARRGRGTGLLRAGEVAPGALLDLLDPLLEPLRHEVPVHASWLRSLTLRFSDPRSAVFPDTRKLHIPGPVPARPTRRGRHHRGVCLLGATVPLATEVAAWIARTTAPVGGRDPG